jgi:hypothetical protein
MNATDKVVLCDQLLACLHSLYMSNLGFVFLGPRDYRVLKWQCKSPVSGARETVPEAGEAQS